MLELKQNGYILIIYQKKFIEESSEIILVESIGDVLNLYQNGIKNVICTFGTLISPTLISYIVR